MAFVATSAPQGWKLGRWSQVDQKTWQEEKLDNPQIVYQLQVVNGPSLPGSKTVRLKMKDQNTEVLLLDSSVQVFVNGAYFGEYGGAWQAAGGQKGGRAPVAAKAAAREPPQAAAASRGSSKQDTAFEQTLAPAQASEQKSAPPAKKAPPAAAPQAAAPLPSINSAPDREQFQSWQPPTDSRPRKADGLDKTDASMQKLIGAAKNGDAGKVKECLDAGIDPDGPAKDGQTPLMAATRGGHSAVVEALLGACADPTMGKGEETPLTIAFQKGNQGLLKVLFNASFTNLNTLVGPSEINIPQSTFVGSSEVPDNASYELRDVTSKIAAINRGRPESPEHGKYGNYAHLTAKVDMEDHDTDMLRAESVRLRMRSLAKTAGGSMGVPGSPK